jgi:membrane-associated protease RseP (regulator of RpoE activity)
MSDRFSPERDSSAYSSDALPEPDAELYDGAQVVDETNQENTTGQPVWLQPRYSGSRPMWVPATAQRVRTRLWLHLLLLGLTILTSVYVGVDHWLGFKLQFGAAPLPRFSILEGLWYGGTILLILGAHEMGHYLACRYYGIDASLPYFIPAPPPFWTGTFGAFIRIRSPFHDRRSLFDVGIAGPIAGFVLAVPALVIGIWISNVAWVPPNMGGFNLGEPLIFKLVSHLIWGRIPEGYSLNLHPMAFAAWFGLLATMLNLFPIGQLDGGHIAYTVFGRRSATVTRVMVAIVVALTFFSMSWLFWAILMLAMLWGFGAHHPPTMDDEMPLGRGRKVLAVVALAIFVLCFMPAPMSLLR